MSKDEKPMGISVHFDPGALAALFEKIETKSICELTMSLKDHDDHGLEAYHGFVERIGQNMSVFINKEYEVKGDIKRVALVNNNLSVFLHNTTYDAL
jgi:hypothetical protein